MSARAARRPARTVRLWVLVLAAVDVLLATAVYRSAGWPAVVLGVAAVAVLLVVDSRRPKRKRKRRR